MFNYETKISNNENSTMNYNPDGKTLMKLWN